MKSELVSIIVPNLNYGRFLPACIDSVLSQTYTNWELIVVDDNSTDDSREIVQSYIDAHPNRSIRLFHNEKGPSGTPTPVNIGIRNMRGKYFSWLSSDDICQPNKLECLVAEIEKKPSVRMVFSAFDIIDDEGVVTEETLPDFNVLSRFDLFLRFFDGNQINGNTVLIDRDAFETVGLFEETRESFPRIWMVTEVLKWMELLMHYDFSYVTEKLHLGRVHQAKNAVYDSNLPHVLMGMVIEGLLQDNPGESLYSFFDMPTKDDRLRAEIAIARSLRKYQRITHCYTHLRALQKSNAELHDMVIRHLCNCDMIDSLVSLARMFVFKGAGFCELSDYAIPYEALSYISEQDVYLIASALKKGGLQKEAKDCFQDIVGRPFVKDLSVLSGAYFHLGEMAYTDGEMDTAQSLLSQCVRYNSSHNKAKEYLEALGVACA